MSAHCISRSRCAAGAPARADAANASFGDLACGLPPSKETQRLGLEMVERTGVGPIRSLAQEIQGPSRFACVEIYHRLMRGDDPSSIESRWIAGLDPYLQTALEEVPSAARIWLSRRLGVTPDRALLQRPS